MKKHELLKYAYDNYPKGTVIKNEFGELICSGEYTFSNESGNYSNAIHDVKTSTFIFNPNRGCQWVEIVKDEPEKTAVKVDNETEFKALKRFWKDKITDHCFTFQTTWGDNLYTVFNGVIIMPNKSSYLAKDINNSEYEKFNSDFYTIIPFAEFAKEHNIRIPLLVSEDGVDLFEGDEYFVPQRSYQKQEEVTKPYNGNIISFRLHRKLEEGDDSKRFSSYKAALDWLEKANKPKEIVLDHHTITITVHSNGFNAEAKLDTRGFVFSKTDIEQIWEAYQSLQPF